MPAIPRLAEISRFACAAFASTLGISTAFAGTWTNDNQSVYWTLGNQNPASTSVNPTGGRTIADVNVVFDVDMLSRVVDITLSNGSTNVQLYSYISGPEYPSGAILVGDEFPDALGMAFSGSGFKPLSPLSAFNGQSESGVWTLAVSDGCCYTVPGYLFSWSLILTVLPLEQDLVGTTIPDIIAGDVHNLVGSLDDRMSASWGGGITPAADFANPFTAPAGETAAGLWLRVGGAISENEGAVGANILGTARYEEQSGFLQAGGSATLATSAESRLVASVFGYYLASASDVDGALGKAGDVDTEGLGAGAALTWLAASGWYGDASALLVAHDLDVSTTGGAAGSTDAMTGAATAEVGRRIALTESVSVIPRVQAVVQHTEINTFTDSAAMTYSFDEATRFEGQAGLQLVYTAPSSGDYQLTGKLGATLSHAFLDSGGVQLSGVPLDFGGAGGTAAIVDGALQWVPLGDGPRFGVNASYMTPLRGDGRESIAASATLGWAF